MHAIKTLRFELLADAVPQARRLPERFSALCRQQLAVVLEEEFAAHCPPHQQLRLPQLVLELPPIADRRLEAELPDLLRQALRTALSQLGASDKPALATTPEATAWLDVLEHFLRYGRLPWQVAASSFSLDEVLRSVVKHQAAAFRVLLVRLGQTAQRRQRLVWQLNADQLQLLLVVLEPIHAPFLHAYVLATLATHRRQPLAPVTATALRSIIYELVLADLLLHAGTAFNRRAFLERQVRQLAAQYNLSFPDLLRQLVAAELALTPRTQSALSVLLDDLHQRYRPAAAPGAAGAAPNPAVVPDASAAGDAVGQRPASDRAGDVASRMADAAQKAVGSAFPASAPPLNSTVAMGTTTADTTTDAAANVSTAIKTDATSATATGAASDEAINATTGNIPDSPDFPTTTAAALAYFLQHGSLPLTAPTLTPPQLRAAFPAWLAWGWRGLRPALQVGGPAALRRLVNLFTEPMLMQLLRLAVPGQVRPVLGVLEAVGQQPATRAVGHSRPALWALTFGYLLHEDFRSFSSPDFQQWLTRQLTAAAGLTAEVSTNGSFAENALVASSASATRNGWATGNAAAAGAASIPGRAPAANGAAAATNPVAASSAAVASGGPAPGETLASDVTPAPQNPAGTGGYAAAGPSNFADNATGNTAGLNDVFVAGNAGAGYASGTFDTTLTGAPLSTENAVSTSGSLLSGNVLPNGSPDFPASPAAANSGPATDGNPAADEAAASAPHPANRSLAATTNAPLSLLQAQQVLQYHLAEGTVPPWWPGPAASPARRRALLGQVLRARSLPDFLRTSPLPTEARQRLAELADFAQLTALLTVRRLPGRMPQPAGAALAALERREAAGAAGHASGWLLLLRAAYLDFYLDGGRTGTEGGPGGLAGIRRLAARYQLSVPATLGKIRRLLSVQPALLADDFFASLNQILAVPVAARVAYPPANPSRPVEPSRATPNPGPSTAPVAPAAEGGVVAAQPSRWQEQNRNLEAPNSFLPEQRLQSEPQRRSPAEQSSQKGPQSSQIKEQRPQTEEQNDQTEAQSRFPKEQSTQIEAQSSQTEAQNAQIQKQSAQTEAQSSQIQKQSRFPEEQSYAPEEQSGFPEEQSPQTEAQRHHPLYPSAATERLTQLPTGVAARDLMFYLLRYQRPPWWAPANLTLAQQRQLLTQVAHEYRAGLQALVQAHRAEPAFRQQLAELASFAQLARFVSRPGPAAPGRLAPAVLAALDQQLARAGEPAGRLLRQAYLTAAFHTNPADIRTLAAGVRAQAARAGTSWRTVLRYVAWLHRQLPVLATAPFFAALLAAAAAYESVAGQTQRRDGQRARARSGAAGAVQSVAAATAFEELAEYLRSGQVPVFLVGAQAGSNTAGQSTNAAAAAGTAMASGVATTAREFANSSIVDKTAASNRSAAGRRNPANGTLPQLLAARWQLLLRPEHRAAWQPLKPLLASRTVRARLLAGLAEAEFWPLLRQLYPSHYRLAFRLAADWQLLARQGLVKLSAPALFEVLLALIQATPVASWRPEKVVRALLAAEETLWPQADRRREYSRAGQLLAAIGRRGLVLRGPLGALLLLHQQAGQVAKPAPPSTPIPFIKEEDRPLETIYLANAGLVLLWPFLTMLFDRLGYLENQQFRDEGSRQRAALLLQFLAAGVSEVPEYQLPLNKLLCGMPQSQPLPRELALTAAETELGESLLKAVITRWDALKNTSIAGLRETFLLRPGKLDWLPDDRIVLTVEPKTLDILMDRRPWSISIIKLPWMAAPLYVTWR